MSIDIGVEAARGGLPVSSTARNWGSAVTVAVRCVLTLLGIAIAVQTFIVVEARPSDLITGIHGMADLIRRAVPPDFSKFPETIWPTIQTVDIALFGTMVGIVLALDKTVDLAFGTVFDAACPWLRARRGRKNRAAYLSLGNFPEVVDGLSEIVAIHPPNKVDYVAIRAA